ncbi:hypothetical protein B0H14DRAFT_1267559 [Mycena olivaceomarginata]|nr:hypothetical protein B0H14DRAFT_1267559 [Mycena olivaceomarginata]
MPHYMDPFPPLDIHNLLPAKQQPNFAHQPLLRELLECPPDPSEELRKFVYDQMWNPDLNRDYTSINFGDPGLMHQTPPLTPHVPSSPSQYRNPIIDMSPSYPGPPPNSPLPPIPSARSTRVRNFVAAPPSPTSPDPRIQSRNLTRQPRSVPFARMLQRRLSSVPKKSRAIIWSPALPHTRRRPKQLLRPVRPVRLRIRLLIRSNPDHTPGPASGMPGCRVRVAAAVLLRRRERPLLSWSRRRRGGGYRALAVGQRLPSSCL